MKNDQKNFLVLIPLLIFFIINLCWPLDQLGQAQLGIRRWPFSPTKHLQIAKAYFNHGYENEAKKELQRAQELYAWFKFLDFNSTK